MVFGEEYNDPIMSTMTSTASLHNNFAEIPSVENIVQYMDNTTKLRMNMLGEIGSINDSPLFEDIHDVFSLDPDKCFDSPPEDFNVGNES